MKSLWLVLGLGTGLLMGQAPPSEQPSLADQARKAREEFASTKKAKRVFTNDNMPHQSTSLSTGASTVAAEDAEKAGDKAKAGDDKSKVGDKDKKAAVPKEDEALWRARFAKLRETLDTEKRRLDVLQRELNLAQVQAYSDPNEAVRENFTRSELNKRTADITAQKQVVAAASKAVDDLMEEARQKGVPPGWTTPQS